MSKLRMFLIFIMVSIFLGGCTSMRPGASMRVDIDVYKGPLSKSKEIQLAELQAVVEEAKLNLKKIANGIIAVQAGFKQKTCKGEKEKGIECSVMLKDLESMQESANNLVCAVSTSLLLSNVDNDKEKQKEAFDSYLKNVARVANRMKVQATSMSMSFTPYEPKNFLYRIQKVALINTLSEYGNQLASRAAVLHRQLVKKEDRKVLPLSSYLADSSPTDFPNLYKWHNAKAPWYFEGHGANSLEDRIKMYERLYADQYWSKVNSVYASGVGKVSMAMIRDEVGNWNLKSFDNNPEKLMKAYHKLTLAGLKTLTRLATSGAAGPGGVRALVATGNKLFNPAEPDVSEAAMTQQINALHQQTLDKLTTLASATGISHKDALSKAERILHDHTVALSTLQGLMVKDFSKADADK